MELIITKKVDIDHWEETIYRDCLVVNMDLIGKKVHVQSLEENKEINSQYLPMDFVKNIRIIKGVRIV